MTHMITDLDGKHVRDETGKYIHTWGVMGSITLEEAKKVVRTSEAKSWLEVAQCSMCKKYDIYGGGIPHRLVLTEKQFDRLFELVPDSYDQDPTRSNGLFRARSPPGAR